MTDHVSELDSLGLTYGTDKSSWGHDFLRFYENYFERIRNTPLKLLEIGIAGGASLKVWEDYFPNASIIGADINPDAKRFARKRIAIELIDQSKSESLTQLGSRHGPFDIIIEDGSHMWEHQILTLKTMFPYVTDGGIYIVEDLQTNFGKLAAGFSGNSTISCVEYIKKLVDARVSDSIENTDLLMDPFLSYGKQMKTITFYRESCLIQRSEERSTESPLIANSDVRTNLTFVAHIGGYGDRRSKSNFVHGRNPNQNIQGFSVDCDDSMKEHLRYRALLRNGTWTEWKRCGEFVGTRGQNEDLYGLSFELSDQGRKKHEIQVIGSFRGVVEPIIVGNAEDCFSTSELWGMQVNVRAVEMR